MKYEVVIIENGQYLKQPWTIESKKPIYADEIYGAGTLADMADKDSPLGAPFKCGQYRVIVTMFDGKNRGVALEYVEEPAKVRDTLGTMIANWCNRNFWPFIFFCAGVVLVTSYIGSVARRQYEKGFSEGYDVALDYFFRKGPGDNLYTIHTSLIDQTQKSCVDLVTIADCDSIRVLKTMGMLSDMLDSYAAKDSMFDYELYFTKWPYQDQCK